MYIDLHSNICDETRHVNNDGVENMMYYSYACKYTKMEKKTRR